MLIMCAHVTSTGGTLEGSEQDFEALLDFLGEE